MTSEIPILPCLKTRDNGVKFWYVLHICDLERYCVCSECYQNFILPYYESKKSKSETENSETDDYETDYEIDPENKLEFVKLKSYVIPYAFGTCMYKRNNSVGENMKSLRTYEYPAKKGNLMFAIRESRSGKAIKCSESLPKKKEPHQFFINHLVRGYDIIICGSDNMKMRVARMVIIGKNEYDLLPKKSTSPKLVRKIMHGPMGRSEFMVPRTEPTVNFLSQKQIHKLYYPVTNNDSFSHRIKIPKIHFDQYFFNYNLPDEFGVRNRSKEIYIYIEVEYAEDNKRSNLEKIYINVSLYG